MIDFSNKKIVQQHHDSFMKSSNDLIDYIKYLQEKYESIYKPHMEIVKDRDAIRDDTQSRISGLNIKLDKQLKNCNNAEINREVLKVIDSIPDGKKEQIQINLLKINNRYLQINKSAKSLMELMDELGLYRVPEKDETEEVVLDFSKVKNKKSPETKKDDAKSSVTNDKTAGMEYVVDRHPASPELLKSLNDNLESKKQDSNDNLEKIFASDDNTLELENIQKQVKSVFDQIDEQDVSKTESTEDDDQEYILFTIDDKITLKEIAKNVYKDENCWISLYKYGQNYNKIKNIAKKLDVDVEEIASTPGYLENITLQFPTNIPSEEETIDEQIEEYSWHRKAA